MHKLTTTTEYTAWATTTDSMPGTDSGVSITAVEIDADGYRNELGLIAGAESATDWAEWDVAAADEALERLGWARISTWTESGGQWAAEVEQS